MKLAWKLHDKGEELWCKVLKRKYCVSNLKDCRRRSGDFKLWRDIIRIVDQVYDHGS